MRIIFKRVYLLIDRILTSIISTGLSGPGSKGVNKERRKDAKRKKERTDSGEKKEI